MLKKNRMKIVVFLLLFFVSFIYINAAEELPDNGGIITSSQITNTVTGTGPFDDNDEPGNDSSADNNIVRSFDTVSWTIENTMAVNGTGESGYMGGKIYFEASLPEMLGNRLAEWDLELMSWIQEASVSSDGLTLTGYYTMNSSEVTVPGKQNLEFYLKLYGVTNGTEFQPTIKMWLNGNSEDSYSTVIPEKVIVSSTPKYNLALGRSNFLNQKKTTVEIDGESIEGRMYGYGVGLELRNEYASKGLKGIEYPQGKITFELDFSVKKTSKADTSLVEDITDNCTPVLWEYKMNSPSTVGNLGRNMVFGNPYSAYGCRIIPSHTLNKDRLESVYNGGEVSIQQEGNKLYVTIENYEFDGDFPIYTMNSVRADGINYSENRGMFSPVYMQILVPINESNEDDAYTYTINVQSTNTVFYSSSGQEITEQVVTEDDTRNDTFIANVVGTYRQEVRIVQANGNPYKYTAGNGYAYTGRTFYAWADTVVGGANDEENSIRTVNKLIKFDANAVEPTIKSSKYYHIGTAEHEGSQIKYNHWFATKKDGTNWSSQDEMNTAKVEDLVIYSSYEDIPEGHLCVAEYFESYEGYLTRGYDIIYIYLKVKNTATIGETYMLRQHTMAWTESLDRSVYTAENESVEWPEENRVLNGPTTNYVKTEYDEDMNIISGTHRGGISTGQSLLIIGADLKINKETLDEDGASKTTYDLSKNEDEVIVKLSPVLAKANEEDNIEDVDLKIVDTLPAGMSYVTGSATYKEPDITTNSDGTTTLTWYLYDLTVGDDIEPITYNAKLSENLANGSVLESSVNISEAPGVDTEGNLVYKIGNLPATNNSKRVASSSITVINLASHRLYKSVTTPVIEINGNIHFSVSYKNNTDDVISEFQLLDILPYNGDSRGSSFNGTYKLDRLVVTQQDSSGTTIANDNLQILYTNDESARTATSKDTNLGEGWTEVTSESINQSATAIALKGEIGSQGSVTVDIYLTTENNSGLDKYINNATAQVYSTTEEITTSNATTQVVERTIEGTVWYDSNNNGIQDDTEAVAPNVELILTDDQGQQVTDVKGNIVTSTTTDENGYYKFSSLPIGTYYVRVVMPNSIYTLTEKEVGTNSEVNSKYNTESNETDEITKLNSLDLPVLTATSINAGLVKKETKVNVYHVEKGTDTSDLANVSVLYPTETISGRVDDAYTTQSREAEINVSSNYIYELATTPTNATGTMTLDEINVIYEYSIKEGGDLVDNGGIVSSAQVINIITGTGPFDENDEPGNDSSADNNIVRSFDQIVWTIENTLAVNNTGVANYTGGYIYIEASLPTEYSGLMDWDTDYMKWAEDATISEDGTTFSARYHMSTAEVTIPGKQNLTLALNVEGAANETIINPNIKVWLQGNEDENKVTLTNIEDVIVSAAPKYNIKLIRNPYLSNKLTLDYGEGDTLGRLYGYGVLLQLYNEDTEKGLKGIEYPTGDITFDIDLELQRTLEGSTETEDITDLCTPILWNYNVNNRFATSGNIADRQMTFSSNYTKYLSNMPLGVILTERRYSIYNSGNYSIVQEGNKLKVTISDYDFDGIFPTHNYLWGEIREQNYSSNIGCFSAGYIQVFVPDNEANTIEDRKYYLKVANENFKATTYSGEEVTEQVLNTDDSDRQTHYILKKGSYGQVMQLHKEISTETKGGPLGTSYGSGDAYATHNQNFMVLLKFTTSNTNDYDIYSASKFFKFDGEAVEPRIFSDGNRYRKDAFAGDMEFNIWYVTKKDGTNWESQTEMNNGNIEDMNVYENLEDIPDGHLCIGLFIESSGGALIRQTGDNNSIFFPFKVKETAQVGQTYGFTQRTKLWKDELDRSIYTVTNTGVEYPAVEYDSGNRQYIKTEYDENGSIVEGTDYLNNSWGNTILISIANLKLGMETLAEDGTAKETYNISKNEYDITYTLSPVLTKLDSTNTTEISDVTLKVEDTLPQGLTYVANSCNYGEPELTNNDDGTTTLVWEINNCTVGEEVEALTFDAHIDEDTPDGTQYTNTAVVSGDRDKIGVIQLSKRTATNTVQIVNLASHRLYKTVEQSVSEMNEMIHYKLTYKNNTTSAITDFQLLDILPYNGDSRGSSFNGTYKLDSISVARYASDETKIEDDAMTLYYTNDESVREGITSKDTNIGTGIWQEVTVENINQSATAIALKGEAQGQEQIIIDIYLQPENNQPSDVYANTVSAQTDINTEEITSSTVKSYVVNREINGTVWYDTNNDGIMDEGEEKASGVEITLTDEVGQQVTDINGDIVSSVTTDENGYYKFEKLERDSYYVKITMPNNKYTVTEKEVGINSSVNSKFNEDSNETDLITKLNTTDLAELTASNVNAGLVKKETKVNVYHIEKGTDTSDLTNIEVLYPTETIKGRVDDEYTTESRETEINDSNEYVYELTAIPDNAIGLMTVDEINVIYEYSVIKGKITITKTDRNDSTKFIEGATFKIERIDDENNVSSTFTTMESTTNSNGVAEFSDVPIGRYRVTEIKAAEGYELLEDVIIVELTKENKELNITASDRLKLELPKTGGINYTITISAIGLAITVISILILKNKSK